MSPSSDRPSSRSGGGKGRSSAGKGAKGSKGSKGSKSAGYKGSKGSKSGGAGGSKAGGYKGSKGSKRGGAKGSKSGGYKGSKASKSGGYKGSKGSKRGGGKGRSKAGESTSGRRPPRDRQAEDAKHPDWGSVARRGAATGGSKALSTGGPQGAPKGGASRAWRDAVARSRSDDGSNGDGAEEPTERWERVDDVEVRAEATGAVERGVVGARPEVDLDLHADARAEIETAVGARRAPRFESRLKEAATDFDHGRWGDARRILVGLVKEAPDAPAVRELYGLTLYRLEQWRDAARQLEAFRLLTGSNEQHPVLADCYRALGNHTQVQELWRELKEASPDQETLTEGRIVVAGAQADEGDLRGAIATLGGRGWHLPKRPGEHHLRRAYALADLYERAGDVPAARNLFARVDRESPRLTDAADRVRALS